MGQRRERAFRVGMPWILCTVLLVAGCTEQAPKKPKEIPQDILLITIDTLRADRLGLYGHEEAATPTFDMLGAQGRRFDAAFTPFPRTTPALATLHTGRWPQVHGSREVSRPVRKDLPFLAQLLKEKGFTTLGVSANGAAGERQNMALGYDDFVSAHELKHKGASFVTDAALQLMESRRDDERLFLWVHYIDPHWPYVRHQDVEMPGPKPDGTCDQLVQYANTNRSHTAHVVSNRDGKSAAALEDCRRVYDEEVAHVDGQMDRLLKAWAEARGGTLDRTLVITTSDHGENHGEWDLFYQHGPNVHDAGLRIPLIFTGPGVEPGVETSIVSLEDVMPTVLSMLDFPEDSRPPTDGRDLTLATGDAETAGDDRLLYAESGSALLVESFRYITSGRSNKRNCLNGPRYSLCEEDDKSLRLYDHVEDPDLSKDLAAVEVEHARALVRLRRQWPAESARQRAVRQGRFKLVEIPQLQGGYSTALFDTETDPMEAKDISDEHPELTAKLKEALDLWTATLPVHEGLGTLSPEEEQELRALGYID